MIRYVLKNYGVRGVLSMLCDEYVWSVLKHVPGLEGILLRRAYLRLFAAKGSPSATVQRSVTIRSTSRLSFGRNLYINRGCHLDAFGGSVLGDNVGLGPNVVIVTCDHGFFPKGTAYRQRPFTPRKVVVGDNTMLCANCYINPGVTIGSNCILAAGTALFVDVPDNQRISAAPIYKYSEAMKRSIRLLQ